jgi:hypothetical protein
MVAEGGDAAIVAEEVPSASKAPAFAPEYR